MDDIKKAMLLKLKGKMNQEDDAGEALMSNIKDVGQNINKDKAVRLENELSYTPFDHYEDRPTTGLDVELTKKDPSFWSSTQERYDKKRKPMANSAWTGGNDPRVGERWSKIRELNKLKRDDAQPKEDAEIMSKMGPEQVDKFAKLNEQLEADKNLPVYRLNDAAKMTEAYDKSPERAAKMDRRQELMDRKMDAMREAPDEELALSDVDQKRLAERLARFSNYGK